jgi:hypothetical protein
VRHPHLQLDLRGLSSRGVAIHDQLQPAGPKQQEKCRRHPRSQSGQEQQERRLLTAKLKMLGMAHGMQLLDFWGTATDGVCVDRHAFSAAAAVSRAAAAHRSSKAGSRLCWKETLPRSVTFEM